MFSNYSKIKLFLTLFFAMNLYCYCGPATLYFSVDNIVNSVSVNGNSVSLAGISYLNDWTVTKTLALNIKGVDTLEICGSNYGTYSTSNPAGIIATLKYINVIGAAATLNTDSTWKCGCGGTAKEGENNDTTTIWYSVNNNSFMTHISPTAWRIWNKTLSTPSQCCSVAVPLFGPNPTCGC